ncbi:hypothetical protein [Pseudoalteromonas agarivorans]|uniref:Uncharacterized protein n=1 Tax=Pseudoalteromonas agarivorans TaxID=176102 RepID=A0AAD0TZW6_9GAMM|nr:hypothetical protein [Pseudoalteromonas agarivorans]AYM87031.1 hypothetical protein D9T18_10135 [Pseudoalteromonas agarivorans]
MNFGKQVDHILSHPCMNRFTVKEVRAAYLFMPCQRDFKDLSELRRAIYAELLKYEKRGWLKKSVSAKKGITTYTKTETFDIPFEQVEPNNHQAIELSGLQIQEVRELYTRLNDYKNDLLEGIGKADEFRSLREIYPHLHNEFQPEYNKVRESNSRLLGKIDALEKTLSKLQRKEDKNIETS